MSGYLTKSRSYHKPRKKMYEIRDGGLNYKEYM